MIRFNDVSKDYAGHDVLRRVSCELSGSRKVGLVGRNGAGKTTLIRLLLGEEEPSRGSVERGGMRVGFVPQELPPAALSLPVEGWLLAGYRARRAALAAHEARLTELGLAGDEPGLARELSAYQRCLDELEAEGGDAIVDRALGLLESLGLPGKLEQPIETLSGGERNVLCLARALLDEPDVLVLDEPGNHLDFAGLEWLETFLSGFRGGLLVVSHNRYLLDRVAEHIWEIEEGKLSEYAGNYSQYRLQKLGKLAAQQSDYAASQKRLAQLEQLVARLAQIAQVYDSAAAGKRLRAKRSQLERERAQATEKPELDTSKIELRVAGGATQADVALCVDGYSRAIETTELFERASLLVRCGERLALVGPNGCGKSTLLSDIVRHGAWDHPTLRVGPSLRVGYCAQHAGGASLDASVLDYLLSSGAPNRDRAFSVLHRYLFDWKDLEKRVADLSGGEKNRLQLAAMELSEPSLVILDEPTNHMDVFAREAIEDALSGFEGTLIVVSHDRYLLEKLGARIVEVRDRKLERFDGGFTEYWRARGARRAATKRSSASRSSGAKAAQAAAAGRPRSPGDGARAAAQLERRIEELEGERQALEARMTRAFDRGDHAGGRQLTDKLATLARSLERLYADWVRESG